MFVQSGKMLEEYCARVLLPYLRSEIEALGRVIEERNAQVRAFGEPRETRQNKKESRKGAASLEPPFTPRVLRATSLLEPSSTSRTPRLLSYSSPVPKILPLTLLPLAQEDVEEELNPPVRQEDLQEMLTAPQHDTAALEYVPDAESDPDAELEARFGLLEAIVTSQSQIIPDFNGSINLDSNDTALSSDENDDEEPTKFSCDKCKFNDRSAAALLAHMASTHNDIFPCQICETMVNGKDQLSKHMDEYHAKSSLHEPSDDEETFSCDKCNFETSVETSLRTHNKMYHSHTFKCDMCQHKAATYQELNQHVKNNHEFITPCTVCGEESDTVSNLQVHILTRHCTQSDAIVLLLKKQEHVMLGMQKQISDIASQLCLSNLPPKVPLVVSPAAPLVQQAPAPSYSAMAGALAPQEGRPPAAPGAVKKILYVTDSIGGNVIIEDLEKATKAKITKRRAYGAVKDASQTYPISNFTDVVPKEMIQTDPDVLILQRDSITLTNLSEGAPQEYAQQQVKVASQNMVTVATTALASNQKLQQVLLMEAVPRYDGKDELNKYGNKELLKARNESTSIHKHKIVIGVHNLDCEGGIRASRFGDGRRGPQPDMIHMKGPSGKAALTRSVASILASAGLTSPQEAALVARPGLTDNEEQIRLNRGSNVGFQVQGRRGMKGRKGQRQQQQFWQQQQHSPFEVATFNRFASFQGNW